MTVLAPGTIERYNQLLTRLTSSKGEPLEGIAPELLASLSLEQAPANAYEYYFMMGTTRYSSGLQTTAAPGAGFFSAAQLTNPIGSNVLAVIEDVTLAIIALTLAPGSFNWGLDQQALGGGVGFGIALDTREPTARKSVCQTRISAGLASLGVTDGNALGQQQFSVASEETESFSNIAGVVLAPGHSLSIANRITQGNTSCFFYWRERPLGASELLK